MADYSITAVDRRTVLSGSAGTGPYAFNFPVLTQTDLAVYKDDTKLSLTTDYTVSIGAAGTGTVTLGVAATASNNITIVGARAIERTTDFVTAGDLLASSLNTELDSLTIFSQQVSEDADRAIKAPVTDPTSIDMTLPTKASRAGKTLAFDETTGNPVAGEEIGNYRGDWAAGTSYSVRDLVKDTSTNNIFRAKTAHTSSGSQPLTTNTDSAKWDLIVDAAAASTSATAAAASATAAASSATASASSATSSATAQAAAETAQAAAETAQAAAETAKTGAETAETNSASSATASAASATSAAASAATAASNAGTQSVDRFNGDGSTTAFTMSSSPATENNTMVYISGVYQQKDTYSTSGTTLTFSTAPPSGTGNIEVMHMSTLSTGVDPTIGTVTTGAAGSSAAVTATGHVLDFTIPRGDTGAAGSQGATGPQGAAGNAATIAAGSATGLAAGASPTVTNSGTSSAATFDFGIPAGATGATGATGPAGAAATIAVGTVTTLAAGSSATVTNSGSSSAATFDFGLPQGAAGTGDVTGPSSSTDNAVVRFDATTGKLLQNSAITVDDTGTFSTSTNADLELDPNGSGKVVFKGNATKGAGQFVLNCENNSHGIVIKGPPHSAAASYTLTLPNDDGSADQVLKTDGSGTLSWVTPATTYTHPNHSGEVTSTGDGATVIVDNVVDEANLKVSNAPTDGYILTARSGNTGGMTWEAAAAGGGATWEVVTSGNALSSGTFIDISSYKHVKARFTSDATPSAIHGPKLSTSGSSNTGVSTSKGYYYRSYPNGSGTAPYHSTYAGGWSPSTNGLYYGGSAPEQSVKLWELELWGLDQTQVGIIARTQATGAGQQILSWSGRTSSGSSSWYLYVDNDLDNYLVLGAS